jgi:hypothetical protein
LLHSNVREKSKQAHLPWKTHRSRTCQAEKACIKEETLCLYFVDMKGPSVGVSRRQPDGTWRFVIATPSISAGMVEEALRHKSRAVGLKPSHGYG